MDKVFVNPIEEILNIFWSTTFNFLKDPAKLIIPILFAIIVEKVEGKLNSMKIIFPVKKPTKNLHYLLNFLVRIFISIILTSILFFILAVFIAISLAFIGFILNII